jgi:peptide/nickel transport system ATP-binding protein/oligopeptide transport system ATP-binding protein
LVRPALGEARVLPSSAADRPILEVENLSKLFPVRKGLFGGVRRHVHAIDGVSFHIDRGETLALVGESGCGKSTVARSIVRLIQPTSGAIRLDGEDITHLRSAKLRPHRRKVQMIFQDPASSLDPRQKAGDIVGELLLVHSGKSRAAVQSEVANLFARVGLQPSQLENYPHEFSGGQRQRIGIARALSLDPALIVCDEAISALDVSIQAQIINLLVRLQKERRLSYLFIAHDLAVVEHIAHRVAVMYLGRIVEIADKRSLFGAPRHPYTESLLDAVPKLDPRSRRRSKPLEGDVPSPINRPTGCHFHTRCPLAVKRCQVEAPALEERSAGHLVACHFR